MTDALASKLAKASIEVGSLAADKTNKEQNYAYISADQILQRAGDALAKNGITVYPSIVGTDLKYVDRGQGKNPRIDANIAFLMSVTDGETKQDCEWVGYGSDYATPDKAVYKAITSGHKYFLMKLLNIGIGNEDGEHETESEPKPRKQEQPKPTVKPNEIITAAEWERFEALVKRADEAKIQHPAYERAKMDAGRLNGVAKWIEQELSKAGK